MPIKLDLHIHSMSHGKIFINAAQLKNSLRQRNLDGVAITNFSDISHAIWLKKELQEYIIIIGQEIWTEKGHIIGLGLRERVPDFQSAEKTISDIHNQAGIAIAPHPYLFLGIGKEALALPIDAIESYNGLMGVSFFYNYLAMIDARRMNIPQVASTDTTNASFIGTSYTEVITENKKIILEAIATGKVKLHKRALPVPVSFIIKNILNFKDIEPCFLHAVPCFICYKSIIVKLFKRKFRCFVCGEIQWSRIVCCNGHYICKECLIRKNVIKPDRYYES